jgi:corrinoid protein of di/trimethylamine methyltransferase
MASEERTKEIINEIRKALINYDEDGVQEWCKIVLDEGVDPFRATMEGIADGMIEVGDLYNKKEYFVPELLLCSDALYAGLDILRPAIKASGRESKAKGSIVLGVVEGDVHDIGLELVGTMLETAGFEVRNMGPDVPTEDIVAAVKEENPHIVGLSALLSNTMDVMPDVIEALAVAGLRDSIKVMVGGAPVKQDFADEIGADGWAYDAASAVPKAKELRTQLPD